MIAVMASGMFAQMAEDFLQFIPQPQVGLHQGAVDIREDGATHTPAGYQVKEERPAAQKGFMINIEVVRQLPREFGQETGLASGPLQERPGQFPHAWTRRMDC